MRAVVRKLIPLIVLAVLSANIAVPVQAGNFEDAIDAYNDENYTKAINLFKKELQQNPDNLEIYQWLGKSYEGKFKLKEALEAYTLYNDLKRKNLIAAKSSITPIPSLQPETNNPIPSANPTLEPIQSTPMPMNTPLPSPTASATSTPLPVQFTPVPSASVSPLPELTSENSQVANLPSDNKSSGLVLDSKGWEELQITNFTRKKKIPLIPKDSSDLQEVSVDAGKGNEFIVIQFNIKYNNNILIKADSDQILLKDHKGNNYHLFALSTYIFKYGKEQVSQKVETLLVHDYYQLSVRDSRNKITMVFKVPEKNELKELQIMGYKNIDLNSYNV